MNRKLVAGFLSHRSVFSPLGTLVVLTSVLTGGFASITSAQTPVADDFNGTGIDTSVWTVVAPAGGSIGVSNGHLIITVPGGSNHDAFTPALDAVQLEQFISNVDFDVNVKIDSTLVPSAAYSGEGILVEGDAHNYIRFGLGSNGSSVGLGANTIINGTEATPFHLSPFSGYVVPTYIRLNRTGTTYTGYWSSNGVNWNKAGSFTDSLTVTGLAPYGWNYQSTPSKAPALTASFDWFHNTSITPTVATPTFNPPSGATFSSTLSVSLGDSTPGSTIYYTTDGSTPNTSSPVYANPITLSASTTIQALATASGYQQSGIASASYTQTAAVAATPAISPASGTTFASTLSVSMTDTTSGATIYYTTDGSIPSPTSSTPYTVPFTISATTTVKAIATASGFTQSAVASAIYTLTNSSTGGVVSDNFDEPSFNTSLWTIENPLGDGTVTMNGSGVTLNVPTGTNHDLSTTGDNTVRIMQPVSNSDFSVDVRFQSAVEIGNQDEGILVEQDSGDFVRFDVLFNGTTGPKLFAAGVSGATQATFVSTQITLTKGPLVLRLARSGNVWSGSWSTDGVTFTAAPNFTFDLNAARIGPYAGTFNTTASNAPAFTAVVDYFFATADPIANADGPSPWGYVTVDGTPASTVVEKALADIQGTGHLEPVIGLEAVTQAGSGGPSGIYWYSYPASGVGGAWNRHTIIGSGNGYEDMVPLDVNGDGAVDIIASFDPTFNSSPEIVWFENPRGSGGDPTTLWNMHVVGPGNGENSLQLADIDGDGKIDIVTPTYVYFQNSPTSWTGVRYSTSFRGVALLDIGSGKGSINLVGTQTASPYNLIWWENPRENGGNARTGKWIMHTIGPGYPCSANNCSAAVGGGEVAAFAAADLNGDGMMDVISAQSEGPGGGIAPPPGGVIWWQAPTDRRNGTWIQHTIDYGMVDVHKVSLGDMDNNGTLDIIVSEQDQAPLNRVAVFYNDGKGNLIEQIVSNSKGHNQAVGDIIGNGKLDILNSGHGYSNDAHPLQIFLNPY